jgi:hypothetical protein
MKIADLPFTVTDWRSVPEARHPGERGCAVWRTLHVGDIRIRMVDYSPDYLADHWCDRGHVLLVLDGELTIELQNSRTLTLTTGMSFQVSNNGDAAHRPSTVVGAKVFIVD